MMGGCFERRLKIVCFSGEGGGRRKGLGFGRQLLVGHSIRFSG